MRRLPIVGVMGSGRERHEALAIPLGRWLAERGAHGTPWRRLDDPRALSACFEWIDDRLR
ncbi:MAG: hypothetical protein VYE22_30620 [Myxococcota bacterium]|nr:hypothetical protein [Myxococcota bacterium]